MKIKNKISLIFKDISDLNEEKLNEIVLSLPQNIKDKIDTKGKLKDKLLTAVSYKMLFDFCEFKDIPEIIFINNGKPCFKNEDIYFSISHSKIIALVAVSVSEIGADIERTDKKRDYEALAKRYFSENEYKEILESENIGNTFIKFWTAKESYIKFTGDGFKNGVKHIEVSEKNGKLQYVNIKEPLYTFNIEGGYFLSVTSKEEKETEIIKMEEI